MRDQFRCWAMGNFSRNSEIPKVSELLVTLHHMHHMHLCSAIAQDAY